MSAYSISFLVLQYRLLQADSKSKIRSIDIFNKYLTKDRSIMRSDPKQHRGEEEGRREGGGGKEERLFLLAEQTEAFLLVFLSFARAGLGRCCCDWGWQRLSACGGGGRAMAAGRDLRFVAWHGSRDGRDPRVHLLLEGEEKEREGGGSVRAFINVLYVMLINFSSIHPLYVITTLIYSDSLFVCTVAWIYGRPQCWEIHKYVQ